MDSIMVGSLASPRRTSRRLLWARSSSSRATALRSRRLSPGRLRTTSALTSARRRRCEWCCPTTPRPRRSRCPCYPTPFRPSFRSTVLSRVRQLDKGLFLSVVLLALYGLATLYSAGQTDVPTFVATIRQRQVVWLAVVLIGADIPFPVSPRMAGRPH